MLEAMIRTAIVAINDEGAHSPRVITTVAEIRRLLTKGPFVEVDYLVVPDEQAVIRSRLRIIADTDAADLVLTTGGTGMLMKERAPEATKEVIEREVPGLAEYMRAVGMQQSERSILFRGVCGMRRNTLIVNLPGGPKGVSDSLQAILPSLSPAINYMRGHSRDVTKTWVE
jgi:molybdopterin adenylyltransferase